MACRRRMAYYGHVRPAVAAQWRRARSFTSAPRHRPRLVRIGSNSKKKPPTAVIPGNDLTQPVGFTPRPRPRPPTRPRRAFCSLGEHERRLGLRPRAPARQIYRAFCTKKDAERHIETVDPEGGEDALEELAFIAVVGDFAGVPSWREEIPDEGEKVDLLRWQPPLGAVRLGVFENLGAGLTGATVAEVTGERLRQELHVIDLRTFQCVTLLSMVPNNGMDILDSPLSQLPELQDDDAVFFTSSQNYAMRKRHHLTPSTLCVLFPFLALRPTQDGHCLMFAEFVLESRPPPYYGELHESMRPQFINNDESYCEFVAEVIRQTHSR